MPVRTTTFRVALAIILLVAILIIIEASWSIWFVNRSGGDDCPCTGITNSNINSMRGYQVFMLILGIVLLIYAIVMFYIPTAERRRVAGERVRSQISERFVRKDSN
jgi:hypothetical protein